MTIRRNHRLVYLLSVAQRRVHRAVTARFEGAVSPAQAGLLFVLGTHDGVVLGEAGAALDLGPAGISGLVDRTVAAGLVERRADESDARAWRVFLTSKGRKSLLRAKEAARAMNVRLADGFSDQEIDVVARWLASIQSKFPRGDRA
jgi:DNA-binding MarR family transcriptional regulator